MVITIDEIRDLTGAPESLIADNTITSLINFIQKKTNQYYSIKTKPTTNIETIHISDIYNLQVNRTPLLAVNKFILGDNEIPLNDIYFNSLGAIRKERSNFYRYGYTSTQKVAKVKYIYGFVEEDEDTTNFLETTINSGTNVNIAVEDGTLFQIGDWISIQDFQSKEIVKIKSISSNNLVVDLVNNYSNDIKVSKLIEPKIIEEFNKYEVCIAVALRAIGSTYTFNTSWSNGGISVNKGIPYPHFEKMFNSNIKLRDELRGVLEGRLISSA